MVNLDLHNIYTYMYILDKIIENTKVEIRSSKSKDKYNNCQRKSEKTNTKQKTKE